MERMINKFAGTEIIASPAIPEFTPRQRLSSKVTVSSEFRDKFDKWLLDFFGRERTFYMMNGKLITNPKSVIALKMAIKNQELK